MSGPLGSQQWMYSAAAGDFYEYQIAKSCRFNRASSHYLNRTIQAGGDLDKWTLSFWVKLTASAGFGSNQYHILTSEDNTLGSYDTIMFDVNSSSQLYFQAGHKYFTGAHSIRDPSAWYHVVIVYDSENGTAAHRKRVWFNGVEDTGSDVETLGSVTDSQLNKNTVHNIGARQDENADYFMDGYLADFIFVDGQVYAPTYFGESKNGCWIPKDYKTDTGEYGTTGYHLDFADSSALGNDVSGNDNDWTVVNLSAHDQMLDSPTFDSTSNGGNFCTLNPAYKGDTLTAGAQGTITEGNLKHSYTDANDASCPCTIKVPPSGKWYFEWAIIAGGGNSGYSPAMGIIDPNVYTMADPGTNTAGLIAYTNYENKTRKNGTYITTYEGARGSNGDEMAIAVDMDNGAFYVSKNGTFYSSGDPTSGASRTGAGVTWAPASEYTSGMVPISQANGGNAPVINVNFGQDGTFQGTETAGGNADANGIGNFFSVPPTDYLAICAGNMPTPSTDTAEDDGPENYFSALLYTGDGQASQAQTGLGFQPDMVLIKERGGTSGWKLFDSNRGVTNYLAIHNTDAETDENDSLLAFGADGFTVGDNAGTGVNTNTYAAWCWKANGGTTATNSDGTLNCTQQVNANAGFSISTYTGNGQNSTIGHGLSSIPDITMFRERGTAGNWIFRIKGDGNDNNLYPQANNATSDGNYFQDTAATTSVTSIGTHADINGSTSTYVMWAWESKEGFSKHGLFEGNGNADGAFVHLGFSPAFVMLKSLDSTSGWYLYDNKREGYNPDNDSLEWDVTTAEQTDDQIDLLSNGFKLRTSGDPNVAETFIYMAFAAVPFKYATAR